MFDPELEAIVKCTELLAPLEDGSKMRVLQYLANRYQLIGQNPTGHSNPTATGIPQLLNNGQPQTSIQSDEGTDFPALKDVVSRDLPKTEVDWVIVYCFYASEYGSNSFTRENIVEKYKNSRRWTENRRKGFGGTLTAIIKRKLIKSLNETEYQMTEPGRIESKKILDGKSTSKTRGGSRPKKKNGNGGTEGDEMGDSEE